MIYTITGPSGSGKTALAEKLCKIDHNIIRIITATTREPRRKERNGVDYHFKSREQFLQDVYDDRFIEYTEFDGNYYGVLCSSVESLNKKDGVVVLERYGAMNLRERFPDLVRSIYIGIPREVSISRMAARDGRPSAERRAKIDISAGLYNAYGFDCILKNDTNICDLAYNFMNYMMAVSLEKSLA